MQVIPKNKLLFTGCKPLPVVQVSIKCAFDSDNLILPSITISHDDHGDTDKELVFNIDSLPLRSLRKMSIQLRFEDIYDTVFDDSTDTDQLTLLTEMAIVDAISIVKIDVRKLRKSKKETALSVPDIYDVSVEVFLKKSNLALVLEYVHGDNPENQLEDAPLFFSKIMPGALAED